MTIVLAIDAGTTGVRTIAFDSSAVAVASAYHELTQHYPRPGWVEHDAAEIWSAVTETMASVRAAVEEPVAAIGITVQRETVVVWSRSTGEPLHRAIVWQDRRTANVCRRLESDGHLPLVRSTTGLVLDPYFSASKLAWIFRDGGVTPSPDVLAGTVDAWLVWKLTGSHVTDATNASRTSLLDIRTLTWSGELCSLFGVPQHVLPEVQPSMSSFGATSDGVPVLGVAGDQQAALFGQACFEPGMAKNTYGTGSFVLLHVGSSCPPPVDGVLTTVACNGYAYEAAVFVTGAAVQWLRDELQIIDDAASSEAVAASVPSTDGVYVVPAFTGLGSPWWDPYARGTVVGITRGTSGAHLARAVLESIAFQTRDAVDAMGVALRELRVDGGASENALLLQLQADQLGVPVRRAAVRETTALGVAYLAGIGAGVWSEDEVVGNWRSDLTVSPIASRDEADAAHAGWLRAVERARDWDR